MPRPAAAWVRSGQAHTQGWDGGKEAAALLLCQWLLLGYEILQWSLVSMVYSPHPHFGALGCVGQLCGSVAAFSCFLFVCFNVISILISNTQGRREYNEHPSTIHLLSTITNNYAVFHHVTEPFHSKLKTSEHFTHKCFHT